MNVDYDSALPTLLISVSDLMEVRTDGTIFEIAYLKPLPASYENTHKAVSLGRFGTLDACVRALVSKVGLYHKPGDSAVADTKSLATTLIQVENAIANYVGLLPSIPLPKPEVVSPKPEPDPEVFVAPTTGPKARAKTLTKTLNSQGNVEKPVKRLRAQKKGS